MNYIDKMTVAELIIIYELFAIFLVLVEYFHKFVA